MTDYQIGLVMAIKGDPGYVFSGSEEMAALRMVILGWLTNLGGGRFAVLPKGEMAYRDKMGKDSDKTFKIRFTKGVNLRLKQLDKQMGSSLQMWRFREEHELLVTKMVEQFTQPTTYLLHLVGGESFLLDVPFSAFEIVEIVEAKRTVT